MGPADIGLHGCGGGYFSRYLVVVGTAHQSAARMICQVTFERSAVDLPWFLTVASMFVVMVPCGVQTALPFIELITISGYASAG